MTRILLLAAAGCLLASPALAQNSSLFQNQLPLEEIPAPTSRVDSWIYRPLPPPKKIQLHDTVNVRVDELARTQQEGEMERRKDALFDAILVDWVEFIGLKALKPSPQRDGDQRIRGQLQQLYRAEGELETRESVAFNIACSVVDVRVRRSTAFTLATTSRGENGFVT